MKYHGDITIKGDTAVDVPAGLALIPAVQTPERPIEIGDRIKWDYWMWEVQKIHQVQRYVVDGEPNLIDLVVKRLHETFWASEDEEWASFESVAESAKEAAEEYAHQHGPEVGATIYVFTKYRPYRIVFNADDIERKIECQMENGGGGHDPWSEPAWENKPDSKKIEEWFAKHETRIRDIEDSLNDELGISKYGAFVGKVSIFQYVSEEPIVCEEI